MIDLTPKQTRLFKRSTRSDGSRWNCFPTAEPVRLFADYLSTWMIRKKKLINKAKLAKSTILQQIKRSLSQPTTLNCANFFIVSTPILKKIACSNDERILLNTI